VEGDRGEFGGVGVRSVKGALGGRYGSLVEDRLVVLFCAPIVAANCVSGLCLHSNFSAC
jgi:hypothetical protein